MRRPEPGSPAADLTLILAHARLRIAEEKREMRRADASGEALMGSSRLPAAPPQDQSDEAEAGPARVAEGPDPGVAAEPHELLRLAELLGEVVADAQRDLARRAGLAAGGQDVRRPRSEPKRFVDLEPFRGMAARKVLLALGWSPEDVEVSKAPLLEELSGENDRRLNGAPRCHAGRASENGLRCKRAAMPNEEWCRPHHPSPPPRDSPPQAEMSRRRLARNDLWQRPDGRVLEGLYALTDAVEELLERTDGLLVRVRRAEAVSVDAARGGWLDVCQAATYTGRSKGTVSQAAARGELSGARATQGGSWAFRTQDLDDWMTSGKAGSGRYTYQPEPMQPARRPRSR